MWWGGHSEPRSVLQKEMCVANHITRTSLHIHDLELEWLLRSLGSSVFHFHTHTHRHTQAHPHKRAHTHTHTQTTYTYTLNNSFPETQGVLVTTETICKALQWRNTAGAEQMKVCSGCRYCSSTVHLSFSVHSERERETERRETGWHASIQNHQTYCALRKICYDTNTS